MPALIDIAPLRVLVDGEDITQMVDVGLQFSTVDPGGFEACTIPVARDCPEMQVGQPIRIESGLGTAWEGRVSEMERSLGSNTTVTGEGWGALAKENLFSQVYVDRDLTRWQQPSVGSQKALVKANEQQQSFQVAPDPLNDLPVLALMIANSWTSPWTPIVDAWYDAGPGNTVAQVYYKLNLDSTVGGNFNENVQLSNDDVQSITEVTGNLQPSAPTSGYFSPATAYRFALLQHKWTGTGNGGAQGQQYNAYFNVACYGPHGLTGRGPDPVGFYPSDIARHAISQLPSSLIVPGVIPDYTGYIVPSYAQHVPVPVEQIVSDMGAVAGVHWGTWESLAGLTGSALPRFDFRPYPPAPTCWCYRSDCDNLTVNELLAGLYNQAVVTYMNVAGVQQSTVVTLDNPYLDAAGINRTLQLDAGTSIQAAAQTFGLLILLLSQVQARAAGSATMSGTVQTPAGTKPSWMVRAGLDRLRVVDLPGQNAFGTTNDFLVTRAETSVTTDGISTDVEFGPPQNLIDVITARLQMASTLASVL